MQLNDFKSLFSAIVFFVTSFSIGAVLAQQIEQPDVAPPGFDEYLRKNKDNNFKIKVVIKKDREPAAHEIKMGSEDEKKLKSGFYKLTSKCNLRAQPNEKAKVLSVMAVKKKLWVEHQNADWAKVYRKKGVPAFFSRNCL